MKLLSLALLAITVAPVSAVADTMYTYTGNPFTSADGYYTTSDYVSGEFTLAAPLAANMALSFITPESYSFTDGVNVASSPQLTGSANFQVSTDSAGNINVWGIEFLLVPTTTEEQNFATRTVGTLIEDYGYDAALQYEGIVYNDPGTWSISTVPTAATPEPSSLLLLGTGLIGLTGMARRQFLSR